MKKKFSFITLAFAMFAMVAVSALLFSGCDYLDWLLEDTNETEQNGNEENGNNNGTGNKPGGNNNGSGNNSGRDGNTDLDNLPLRVEPLLQTKWNQNAPYNNVTPMDANNTRTVTGCGATAIAQVMKHHNYPERGTGDQYESYGKVRVYFNVNYDWKNMLNTYTATGGTEAQRNAVALLMYHAGVASDMRYGTDGSSTNIEKVSEGLTTYFGYDKNIRFLQQKWYDKENWEKRVKAQLAAGLPVIYRGGTHVFIVDGYDDTGKFHINWGWGGNHDGWYDLNDIRIIDGKSYNTDKGILINIKPGKDHKTSYELGLFNVKANKTTVSQNETFKVTCRIYNTGSDKFPLHQIGAALADNNGNIAAIIGGTSRGTLGPGQASSEWGIDCFIPDFVKPGQYSLKLISMLTGEEWKAAPFTEVLVTGVTNNIDFTVTAGETNIKGYGLSLTEFKLSYTVLDRNTDFLAAHNINTAVFFPGGQVGVALIDNDDKIVTFIGTRSINAATKDVSYLSVSCKIPDTVPKGQYRLKIFTRIGIEGSQWELVPEAEGVTNSIDYEVK